jgi:hypothetical protein
LAILAQTFLEPPDQQVIYAVILYTAAAAMIVGGVFRKEWHIPEAKPIEPKPLSVQVRWMPLVISLPFFILAFFTFKGNQFSALNTFFLIIHRIPHSNMQWSRR